jgi:hypothetical protein
MPPKKKQKKAYPCAASHSVDEAMDLINRDDNALEKINLNTYSHTKVRNFDGTYGDGFDLKTMQQLAGCIAGNTPTHGGQNVADTFGPGLDW